ncbi:MAG: hypothetical protein K9N06_10945 [Candidatus Cloacimonetes bacterium]|nr:hypothetical protein [Candidatus Cloacimonadota bacterium]
MKRSYVLVFLFVSLCFCLFAEEEISSFLDKDLGEYWNNGWEAYQAGEYEKAAEAYLEGLHYDITNGSNIYNLACCYGLLGNEKLAAKFLQYSIKNGFENYEHITNDPDFDKVKDSQEFKAVVDSLKSYLEKKKNPAVKELWFSSSAYSKSYIRFPENYDPQKAYPLIVGLHGYGADANSFLGLWDGFEKHDFIYICPETFYPFLLGDRLGWSWFTWTEDDVINSGIMDQTEAYIADVTREIKKDYKISETYLLGFSQGCGLAYATGIRFHKDFEGMMCFGGWLDTDRLNDKMLKKAKDLKVFIAHGTKDTMVEFESGVKAKDKLKEMHYDLYFYEFDDGHRVPPEALQKAQEWLGF